MANMFRCTLASVGGAFVLTVTCDADFAGLTITATDGTTTLTQTCPSSSPYTVEFKIPNAGIWTISSGTDSTSIIIPDTADLHHIPTGSTVTPTGDIQIWLHCANIWDKTYTTISQVLTDASTLQALIASNNAADYMARSATWATDVTADSSAMTYIGVNDYCAEALLSDSTWLEAICDSTYYESVLTTKIPSMTSATTPTGVVKGDASFRSGNEGYKAFDGNQNTYAFSTQGSSYSTFYLEYEFPSNIDIYKLAYTFGSASQSIGQYYVKLQSYINDTWVDILTDLNVPASGQYSATRVISAKNSSRYRVYGNRGSSGGNMLTPTMYTIQLYGRVSS